MSAPGNPFEDSLDRRAWVALAEYVTLKGTADVTSRARVRGFDLGRWVLDCRVRHSAGLLSPSQLAALETLPGWRWNQLRPDDWAAFLGALVHYVEYRYHQMKAHPAIPGDALYAGYRIGVWAGHQRAAYAAGALPRSRIELLEQVPGWVWTEPDPWDRGMPLLRRHLRGSDNATMTEDTVVDGFPLGRWAARLRAAHSDHRLPADRVQDLDELPGWEWDPPPPPTAWDVGFAALVKFTAQTGAANPAQHTRLDGYPVGMWVNTQRRRYKTGALPAEQAQALRALPGWMWSAHDNAWRRGHDVLVRFIDETGQLPSSNASWDGYPVGQWAAEQRSRYRSGRLGTDRVAALEALPGWVWT